MKIDTARIAREIMGWTIWKEFNDTYVDVMRDDKPVYWSPMTNDIHAIEMWDKIAETYPVHLSRSITLPDRHCQTSPAWYAEIEGEDVFCSYQPPTPEGRRLAICECAMLLMEDEE